jgi:hypothetical protein
MWNELSQRMNAATQRERSWGRAKVNRLDLMIDRVVNPDITLEGSTGFRKWRERKVAQAPLRDTDRATFAEYFYSLPPSSPPVLYIEETSQ